jgi:hypothetical protein
MHRRRLVSCLNGDARRGLDEVIDDPDRSVGVLDYELIVPTRRSYRPSVQVLYSCPVSPNLAPAERR